MLIALVLTGFLVALLFSLFLWSSIGQLTLMLAPIVASLAALVVAVLARAYRGRRVFHRRSLGSGRDDTNSQPVGPAER
jgi:membrane protein implicated in regulation of membrane protease activity